MDMTKAKVTQLRKDINNALEAVGKKHGVAIHAGSATYTNNFVKFKLEGAITNGKDITDPTVIKLAEGWTSFKWRYTNTQLEGMQVGDPIKVRTMTGKFMGYDSKKRKYPFIVEVPSGARYKLSIGQISMGK